MLINNIDTMKYGATLLSVDIDNAEIVSDGEFWAENSLIPFEERQKARWGKATCEFLVEQANDDEAEKAISKLISISKSSELVFEDRTLRYKGILESHDKEWISPGRYGLVLTWKTELSYEEEKSHTFTTSATLTLSCATDTPAILEITPTSDTPQAVITGLGDDITIKNLTEGQTVIIDGEKGLVTENEQNKWHDYDSWGFPKLKPGENLITVDNADLDITIKYKPRWI